METKKSIGFGVRGWLLIIVLFFGFMMFQVFTNYPLNILADFSRPFLVKYDEVPLIF